MIFLCDSNGKHISLRRLFPGRPSAQIWSPTSSKAMEQLSSQNFQGVKHILIHTGTNDLTGHNKDIPRMLREVAMKATTEFPTARVTISALLPRRDMPQHVINNINADLIKKCAQLPNVHVALHGQILHQHLCDRLHLNQRGVRLFAKNIKDTALDRDTSTPHTKTRTTNSQANLPRSPRHTKTSVNSGPSLPRGHRPTTPQYALPLQAPQGHDNWQQQQQMPQPPSQRESYATVAARAVTPPPAQLNPNQIRDLITLLCTQLLVK